MAVAGLLCCTEVYIHATSGDLLGRHSNVSTEAALCAIECFRTAVETARASTDCGADGAVHTALTCNSQPHTVNRSRTAVTSVFKSESPPCPGAVRCVAWPLTRQHHHRNCDQHTEVGIDESQSTYLAKTQTACMLPKEVHSAHHCYMCNIASTSAAGVQHRRQHKRCRLCTTAQQDAHTTGKTALPVGSAIYPRNPAAAAILWVLFSSNGCQHKPAAANHKVVFRY